MTLRADQELILELIPRGSRVLDLGCGDGSLLRRLLDRGCTGTGVEVDADDVLCAIRHGVGVIELDIDHELGEFADDGYDVVILSRTLQTVHQPSEVLRQIRRIAKRSVVSMANFALWRNRLRLLRGRMPKSRELPFEWFDTPNLHYTSITDLEPLFASVRWSIEQRIALDQHGRRHPFSPHAANLLASSVMYCLRRDE